MSNSCSCRCIAKRDTSFKCVIAAVDLNEKTRVVRFSREYMNGDLDDYVPLHTVQERKMSINAVAELVKLLSLKWAGRAVINKDQVQRFEQKYTGDVGYTFTGPYEKWKCHRIAPDSTGLNFTPKWRRIEEIIEKGK